MIRGLWIKNLVLVEDAEVSLSPTLTVLTGETGAGKSLILSSFGLAGGSRAQTSLIRQGTERAEIAMEIGLDEHSELKTILGDLEIDISGGELLVRRVLSVNGGSRAFVNGSPVSAAVLQQILGPILEIHGQREQYALSSSATQRDLLDRFGGHSEAVAEMQNRYDRLSIEQSRLHELRSRHRTAAERIDYLRYQVQEFDQLGLDRESLRELMQRAEKIRNLSAIIQGCGRLSSVLTDADTSAESQLMAAEKELTTLGRFGPELQEAAEHVAESLRALREAVRVLGRFTSDLEDGDENAADEIESRIAAIQSMMRRFGADYEGLFDKIEVFRRELQGIENIDDEIAEAEKSVEHCQREYLACAARLTKGRARAAEQLGKRTRKHLKDLALDGSRFEVQLATDVSQFSASGQDQVEYLFSSAPDVPMMPLRKVASGGELSRLMLAIDVATVDTQQRMTLIFDEIDAGVGGTTANAIAVKLREIASKHQVICVTHLPQIAAAADRQYGIVRSRKSGRTVTEIAEVSGERREEELARMLGNEQATASRDMARGMLEQFRRHPHVA